MTSTNTARTHTILVRQPEDIVAVRQIVREWAVQAGFNLLDQTKIVTAASELARNMVDFAGGGVVEIEELHESERVGIKVTFEDHGPGMPDVQLALRDGYTTGSGLGLGLGGARRLVNDFQITSEVGKGTRITIVRWR